jgi:ketosteroid isomerase-like protein
MRRALIGLILLIGAAMNAQASPTAKDEVLAAEAAWSHALAINDVRGIDAYTSDDWVIIGAEGTTTTKAAFLAVTASGDLVHDQMTLDPDMVRVYGDTAILSGVARSGGTWKGQRFATHERSTDVFVKQNGRWRCVFTQLTALKLP